MTLPELHAALNAGLNLTSAVLLVLGYRAIRKRRKEAHKRWMLAAFAASALFLVSYLIRMGVHGSTKFTGVGWVRPVYLVILFSHMILAAAVLPLALRTLWLAWKERFDAHPRIARITLPIWLYTSITGVVVYLMLYHLPAASPGP